MGDKTKIQWSNATWNPVTGCTKVSQGCKHCYAETLANRLWAGQYPPNAGGRPRKVRVFVPDLIADTDRLTAMRAGVRRVGARAKADPAKVRPLPAALPIDDFEPEPLADHGAAAVPDDPTPNPSHPVRSHVRPATWRQVSRSMAEIRYCDGCGIALPVKPGMRCENCGRPVTDEKPVRAITPSMNPG